MTYPRINVVADMLPGIEDLDAVRRAVDREALIRQTMAATGEPREIVVETLDAALSMDEEAVLDLTEGEPTTLADALERYVTALRTSDPDPERIAGELSTLLAYPWPDGVVPPNATLEMRDDGPDHTVVLIGGETVARVEHEGGTGVEDAVTAVHRAVLAALRPSPGQEADAAIASYDARP